MKRDLLQSALLKYFLLAVAILWLVACSESATAPPDQFMTPPSVRIESGSGRIYQNGSGRGINAVVASDREYELRSDGTVWRTGAQVKIITGAIASSQRYVVLRDGSLWVVENRIDEQTKLIRIGEDYLAPVAIEASVTAVLARDNTASGSRFDREKLLVLLANGQLMFRIGANSELRSAGLDEVVAMDISLDQRTYFALRKDGTVWGWGDGSRGQLGHTDVSNVETPVVIDGLSNVKAIAAGQQYLLALQTSGEVFALGSNAYGQLGSGDLEDSSTPRRVVGLENIVAIGAGNGNWSLAVNSKDEIFVWGDRRPSYDTVEQSLAIRRVVALTDMTSIAVKTDHALALKSDGTVWAWGNNHFGQLGFFPEPDFFTPRPVKSLTGVKQIAAGHQFSVALKNDGTVWVWGYTYLGPQASNLTAPWHVPVQLTELADIIGIAASYNQILALDRNGDVWKWGNDAAEPDWVYAPPTVGTGPTKIDGLHDVAAIYPGTAQSMAKKLDGSFWSWRNNAAAVELQRQSHVDGAIDVSVTDDIYFRKADGVSNNLSFSLIPENPTRNGAKLHALDVGVDGGVAIDDDGIVWMWGPAAQWFFGSTQRLPPDFDLSVPKDMTSFLGRSFLTTVINGRNQTIGLDLGGNVWIIGGVKGLAFTDAQWQYIYPTPKKVETYEERSRLLYEGVQ